MKRPVTHHLFTAARWLLIAAVVATLFISWRLIRNEDARLRLVDRILPMVQDSSAPIFEVTGLRWPKIRELQAESLRLFDRDGIWLEVEDVQARLGIRGLINQQLFASSISARRAFMQRIPVGRETTRDPNKPASPWHYEIETITIAQLEIGREVLPMPALASLHGSLSYCAATGGTVSLSSSSLTLQNHSVELDSELYWSRDSFVITQLVVRTPGGDVQGSGWYDFAQRQAMARVTTTEFNVEWLSGLAGQFIRGRLNGSADLVYSNHYAGIAWTASAHDIGHTNVTIHHAQSSGHYEWANREHHIRHSSVSLDNLGVGGHTITSLNVKARTEDGRLLAHAEAATQRPMDVALQTDAEISRTGTTFVVHIPHLYGMAAGVPFYQIGASTIRYDTNRWSAVVDHLLWNGASVKVTAQKNRHLDVQGFVREFNLGIVPEAYRGPVRGGVFDATWRIVGFPGQTEGSVTWTVRDTTSVDHPLQHLFPNDWRGSIQLSPDRIRLAVQTHGATNVSLLGSANLPCRWLDAAPWVILDKESRAMMVVHAALESLAAPYLPNWQHAEGDLKATLGIYGTWAKPNITGNLVIANGFFEDVIRGAVVRDIKLNAGIDSIDAFRWSLTARDENHGNLSATGTYQRVGLPDYVMQAGASLSNFVFGRIFGTDLPIDGSLVLHGTGFTARLTGIVESPPLSIRLPRQLPPFVRSVRVVDINAVATPASTVSRNPRGLPIAIETDIRIRATRGVRVDGRQLRSEWRGNGQITGVIPALRLGGSVNLVRGSFMFLGRRFTVTQGEIIIPSGVRMAPPVVFITAETRASGADITLRVEGSSDSPTLSLSSSPPLEKNDIVARLLFGKSGDSVSPFQIAFLAYALDILEGGGPLLQQLDKGERTLGLDQIDIRQSEEESGLAAVVFGRRVMDRIYIEGEVGLQNEPDVFAVEAELTPSLILRTETSPRIREGISINWRRDY